LTSIKNTLLLHQNNIKSIQILKESIKNSGYDPSQRDDDDNTALHCAAIEG